MSEWAPFREAASGALLDDARAVWVAPTRPEAARALVMNSEISEVRTVAPSDGTADVIRISPLAFLRSMFALLWTAFRHPLSTTYIDVTTGDILAGDGSE